MLFQSEKLRKGNALMKILHKLRAVPLITVLVGAAVTIIGLYYSWIKAGIPYQDLSPELLLKYNSYVKTGDRLILLDLSL